MSEILFSTSALFAWLGIDQVTAFWIVAAVALAMFVALVTGVAISLQNEDRDYDR